MFCGYLFAQNDVKTDSIPSKVRYGLRLGIDLSKPIRMLTEPNYKGLELVADYRLSSKLFIAAELGNETKTVNQDGIHFETSGTYLKTGIDLNVYNNWVGMDNLIIVGLRYGVSQHKQTLLGYNIRNTNLYWEEENQISLKTPQVYEGLNGHWIEFHFGVKAELLRNLYMGITLQMHRLLSDKAPKAFDNLYIPGFNKVLTDNSFGAGLNYTISYQLPIYKK